MEANCHGFEIEPGMYSGCNRNKGDDCPVCEGTGKIEFCPRCGGHPAFATTGDIACPSCGWTFNEMQAVVG